MEFHGLSPLPLNFNQEANDDNETTQSLGDIMSTYSNLWLSLLENESLTDENILENNLNSLQSLRRLITCSSCERLLAPQTYSDFCFNLVCTACLSNLPNPVHNLNNDQENSSFEKECCEILLNSYIQFCQLSLITIRKNVPNFQEMPNNLKNLAQLLSFDILSSENPNLSLLQLKEIEEDAFLTHFNNNKYETDIFNETLTEENSIMEEQEIIANGNKNEENNNQVFNSDQLDEIFSECEDINNINTQSNESSLESVENTVLFRYSSDNNSILSDNFENITVKSKVLFKYKSDFSSSDNLIISWPSIEEVENYANGGFNDFPICKNYNKENRAATFVYKKNERDSPTPEVALSSARKKAEYIASIVAELKAKDKDEVKGCRCGNAAKASTNFRCSGQRCTCYVERRACTSYCRCTGCKNPIIDSSSTNTQKNSSISESIPSLT